MRRAKTVILAFVLAILGWTSTEAFAASTITPSDPAPIRPDNSTCVSQSRVSEAQASGRTGYTLAEAKRCAPDATVISGPVSKAGRYIVAAADGYGIMGISAVSAKQTRIRDALAYNCGDWIGWHINSWYQDLTISMNFDTDNHVSYCYYAHNDYENPSGSVTGGTVQSTMGVINQDGWQINPWLNWVITWYNGSGTSYMYCRHYLDGNTNWSGWCHG